MCVIMRIKPWLALVAGCLAVSGWKIAAAEFAMNFLPADPTFGDNTRIDTRCNRPEGANLGCSGSWSNSGDPTPFLQEIFVSGGVTYYHVIVGLPQNGFAQEIYIKTSGSYEGGASSASLGDGVCRYGGFMYSIAECNISDPLANTHDNIFTGNGSGDPRVVTIRQLIGGTWDGGTNTWSCGANDTFCHEFAKNNYLLKPLMNMTIKDPIHSMQAHFEFDMSNSNYTTNTTPGIMTNTVLFTDPSLGDAADFDFAVDATAGWSNITGGRYTFTGSGPTNATLEPYSYVGGDFKVDRPWWMYKNQ